MLAVQVINPSKVLQGAVGQRQSRKWQPYQYSCLENPMDRGIWVSAVHWVTKSWTGLKLLGMYMDQRVASQVALMVKNPAANTGDMGSV